MLSALLLSLVLSADAAPPLVPDRPLDPVQDGPLIRVHLEPGNTGLLVGRIPSRSGERGGGELAAFVFLGQRKPFECLAPCDKVLRRADDLFYVSRGLDSDMPESSEFSLSGHGSDVTLKVREGSYTRRTLGIIGTVGGGGATVVGLAIGVLAGLTGGFYSSYGGPYGSGQARALTAAGFVVSGVGLTALAAGVILLVTGSTRVDVEFGASPATTTER